MTLKKLALVFALFCSVNTYAGIHKCTDAHGKVLYSDKDCSSKGVIAVNVSRPDEKTISNITATDKKSTSGSFFSVLTEKIKSFFGRFSSNSPQNSNFPLSSSIPTNTQQSYQCDGRTFCSQMTSCDEATFFINHCPNTKMDGDNDGIPCERQWCN